VQATVVTQKFVVTTTWVLQRTADSARETSMGW